MLLPASEFLVPPGGIVEIRERIAAHPRPHLRPSCPSAWPRTSTRFEEGVHAGTGEIGAHSGHVHDASAAARALDTGDAAEVWAAVLCPATGLDHVGAGDAARPRRARRHRRSRRVPVAPGRGAPRRADRVGRAAGQVAGGLPLAARVEEPPAGRSHARADVGVRRAGTDRRRHADGRSLRLARAAAAAGPHGAARRDRRRAGPPTATASCSPRTRPRGWRTSSPSRACRPASSIGWPQAPEPGTRTLVGRSLNGGFTGGPDRLTLVTDRELFGSVRVRRPKALRRVVPRDILERLAPGDLVVHVDHGIARYERMLRRGVAGEERDYLELSFAGTDKIFLPVEQIDRISRYSGAENPALSKLGGAEWIRTKQRVKQAVTDLAQELLEIYAARAAAPGFAYPPDTPWQQEMEASFPYEETLDQLRATAEVKLDMEAGPADGPPGRGRRRLRQDRGRAARRLQGDPGRQAGGRARADDGPRGPALQDVQPALRRLPDHRPKLLSRYVATNASRTRPSTGSRPARSTS